MVCNGILFERDFETVDTHSKYTIIGYKYLINTVGSKETNLQQIFNLIYLKIIIRII